VSRWVIDASVALKWCLPSNEEEFVPQAEQLLDWYGRNKAQFLVPDLFWPEIANALWKAVWKGKIDYTWAEKAYSRIKDLNIPTAATFSLTSEALQMAVLHHRTVYDSVYLVLAQRAFAELITADERLANATAARFPVTWLGAL
jgi:predicted nucleic acid-binding protein